MIKQLLIVLMSALKIVLALTPATSGINPGLLKSVGGFLVKLFLDY